MSEVDMSGIGKDKVESTETKPMPQKKEAKADKAKKAVEPSFFDMLKAEFAKIIWPNKETLVKQTIAVSVCSLALGILIALIDFVFKMGFGFIIR